MSRERAGRSGTARTCGGGSPAALFLRRYVLHSDFPLQASRVRGSALQGESDGSARQELFIEGRGIERRDAAGVMLVCRGAASRGRQHELFLVVWLQAIKNQEVPHLEAFRLYVHAYNCPTACGLTPSTAKPQLAIRNKAFLWVH